MTIEMQNMNMSAECMHRAIQIGLCRRICRERKIKQGEDFFEKMTTEQVEQWRKDNE